MGLKTFNINDRIYKTYSRYCKENGISMSRKIEKFIENELGKINPEKIVNIPKKRKRPKEIIHFKSTAERLR